MKELITNICSTNPNFSIWSEYDQDLLRRKVSIYIDNQEKTSLTFVANQFKGTPTLVLFNEKNELISSWFGHHSSKDIIEKIESFIQ